MVTTSPTLALLWTHSAGAQSDLFTARSSWGVPASDVIILDGGDVIEKPPTFSSHGMNRSSHWPALEVKQFGA
jgi:hypothetical protein